MDVHADVDVDVNDPRSVVPIIQIAGVHDPAEALMLARLGVTHVGMPLRLPVHHEDTDDAGAAAIAAALDGLAVPVLITYLDTAPDIVGLCRAIGVREVQLHGEVEPRQVARVKDLDPSLRVSIALVVGPANLGELEDRVREMSPLADGFITDTLDPATGARGATGLTHDWEASRRLVEASPLPVVLAGGLVPENVARAVLRVRPAGVDAHTGVEGADGRKDPARVRAFVRAARAGLRAIAAPA